MSACGPSRTFHSSASDGRLRLQSGFGKTFSRTSSRPKHTSHPHRPPFASHPFIHIRSLSKRKDEGGWSRCDLDGAGYESNSDLSPGIRSACRICAQDLAHAARGERLDELAQKAGG